MLEPSQTSCKWKKPFTGQDKLLAKLITVLFFSQRIIKPAFEELLEQTFQSCDACFHYQWYHTQFPREISYLFLEGIFTRLDKYGAR